MSVADMGQEAEATEAGVGVLGWLGFITINGAAWGIITTSSYIAWPLGFAFCLIYTGLIIGLALWLERRGQKYRQFVNLLWVIGLSFIFILGIYISVNIIGPISEGKGLFEDSSSSSGGVGSLSRDELHTLLPSNASQGLKTWASDTNWQRNPTFANFNGGVFFTGAAQGVSSSDYLWRGDGTSAVKVTPELRSANSFAEFQSELFFSARSVDGGDKLWRISPGTPGNASLVKEVVSGSQNAQVDSLFVDGPSSKLYFKAGFQCPSTGNGNYLWVNTILSSDGTTGGTVDLRGDPCASMGNSSTSTPASPDKMPRGVVWGVLLLAALPMTVLAVVVTVRKQMPGPSVNVFCGILGAVVCVYLLIQETRDLSVFLKWFITIYTSALWIAILAWSLLIPNQPEWLEELKTWSVTIVGVAFFVIIHIDLEIPFNQAAWRWILYALLSFLQMVASSAVSRSVPMVAGCIGAFVIAWKIAYELVEFADFGGSELKLLAMLAIVAFQGIGIILAAIFYAGQRAKIDALVRSFLLCKCTRPKAASEETV